MPAPPPPAAPPSPRPVVGLITAAGRATRLAPLPCSKEVLPVGCRRDPRDGRPRPKPLVHYLVDQMRGAGAGRLFVVLREGKWDVARALSGDAGHDLPTAFLTMRAPWGPPFTAAEVAPFAADATVLYGFPDVLVHPPDALAQVRARLDATGADMVVGCIPLGRAGGHGDLVRRGADGRVVELVAKEHAPPRGPDDWTWALAAWGPRFTGFLADEVARLEAEVRDGRHGDAPEWALGDVIGLALAAGHRVEAVGAADWRMQDTGTPAGWVAVHRFPGVWDGEGPAPDGD